MSFVSELKRRKVFQVAAVYLVVAWLIMQVVDVVNEPLLLPDWFSRVVILLLAVGFPIAVILSWAFDLTPEGVVRDDGTNVPVQNGGRRMEYVFIGLLVIAVATLLYREFTPPELPVEVVAEEAQREALPNSIAVLPFENLSLDPQDAFFATGIHDTILKELAKIRDVNVIARTSVLKFADGQTSIKQIAEELRVETVMEGSVQYAEGRVLVTAQLIDPSTNSHLWSESYDREFARIFEIQADIATRIAMALEAELLPSEQQSIERIATDSSEAYALYLRALDLIGSGIGASYATAFSLLQEAVEIDPSFALAHARIANVYFTDDSVVDGSSIVERERLAAVSAQHALEIDPDIGYAYITLAEIHRRRLEGTEAGKDYERAIALSPNDPEVLTEYALFKSETMQHVDAVRLAQRGIELDPHNLSFQFRLARVLDRAGSFEAAAIAWIGAEAPLRSRISRVHSEISKENNDAALAYLLGLEDIQTETEVRFITSDRLRAELAYGYSRLGRYEDAVRTAEHITESPAPVLAYLAVGDDGAALNRLNQLAEIQTQLTQTVAVTEVRDALFNIKANPWNDPILDQPEFVEVRSRLGFRE